LAVTIFIDKRPIAELDRRFVRGSAASCSPFIVAANHDTRSLASAHTDDTRVTQVESRTLEPFVNKTVTIVILAVTNFELRLARAGGGRRGGFIVIGSVRTAADKKEEKPTRYG